MASTRNDKNLFIEMGAASAVTAGPAGPFVEFNLQMPLPGIDPA